MKWQIHEAGPKSPSWNMDEDAKRLNELAPSAQPALRFYEWNAPSITYGYFVDPWDYFDHQAIEKANIQLARRPTGGGIIFHSFDLAFSVLVPSSHFFYSLNSLKSYELINTCIMQAIKKLPSIQAPSLSKEIKPAPRGGFCMAKPTQYDLLLQDRKVGGAAIRKTRNGLLYQGSLCLEIPGRKWMQMIFHQDSDALIALIEQTSFPLGFSYKEALRHHLVQEFNKI